ncbi:UDP-4-amino-4,6-dideoxy-N-acetyl-beta-L-altrosamine transaminase [Halobacillus andaensis]|uniref:UDP-4-amino-4, 6-dideoxy-N-acetyl-beta-L-altrosamine transaminase n=2 Tax=Halobacillus andaensis TaxID=1176239 RepID=A0A917EWS9_HALAA|nr:UDP-4-amino-4,6-dideoxy-N-acetyl-beta-L-altrosamine transaminase [Halobacillus andaensis]MBP2005722.1 UDP-4-amino-4,6-dideoxy-N-acetyl-beta-L-altrosamine transaminase [Halobacillus andaensis]GGF26507.1 UDP-4-amino-4,6-dideoxy-N-acetyl-beta-L-altrosamine transaminase [Halobacillus andaensis]
MSKKLAIQGGKPVRETYLPYGSQSVDDEDVKKVVQVLKSDFLTTGPEIYKFEQKISDYVGANYCVAFANGTAALHAACFAAGVKKNDEVITSPMAFLASANCALYLDAMPVFADIDPNTYTISPSSIQSLITDKTKAIIPVDFTGQPAAYDDILAIAKAHGIPVIEDASHALGARYKSRDVGALSDMTMFSFHPVNHVTTGEGGVITTNRKDYYEKLVRFRNHGIAGCESGVFVGTSHGPWYYEMQSLGFNYRMTDLQAALGHSQLNKLDQFIAKRKKYAAMYTKAFQDVHEVITPMLKTGCDSSWHLYILRLKMERLSGTRKQVFEALQKENIGVNVHYIPVYWHPYYQQLGYEKGLCPTAEEVYEEIITLPLFPGMTKADVKDVIKAVKKVISHYAR